MASITKIVNCEAKKISMESYQICNRMFLTRGNFIFFLQFGIPIWPQPALTKYNTKHEKTNLSNRRIDFDQICVKLIFSFIDFLF